MILLMNQDLFIKETAIDPTSNQIIIVKEIIMSQLDIKITHIILDTFLCLNYIKMQLKIHLVTMK